MPGSPLKRARREAAAGSGEQPPTPPTDWGAAAAAQLGVEAPPEESPVPDLTPPANPTLLDRHKAVQSMDRAALIHWWSEQMEQQQTDYLARIEAIRTAGEHPSPFFEEQARMFGSLGLPMDVCARLLAVDPAAFNAYYGEHWETGSAQMMIPVAANLLRIATSSNDKIAAKAAEGILNRRGGEHWKPPAQQVEVLKPGGQKKGVIDSRNLCWEDRQLLRQILQRAIAPPEENQPTGVAASHALEADE